MRMHTDFRTSACINERGLGFLGQGIKEVPKSKASLSRNVSSYINQSKFECRPIRKQYCENLRKRLKSLSVPKAAQTDDRDLEHSL